MLLYHICADVGVTRSHCRFFDHARRERERRRMTIVAAALLGLLLVQDLVELANRKSR